MAKLFKYLILSTSMLLLDFSSARDCMYVKARVKWEVSVVEKKVKL